MPFRRPSANVAGNNAPHTTNYNGRIHIHKSQESVSKTTYIQPSHSVPSLATQHQQPQQQHHAPGSTAVGSATPQQKIVQVLVNRLKNKLPCNSGISLDRLESDAAIQQAIEALGGLAVDSLDQIAWTLCEQTERLSKQTDQNGILPLQVLQSQLFILKVLSVCMAARWSQLPITTATTTANTTNTTSTRPPLTNNRDSPATPPPWGAEPSPLDENCARYVLSCMVLFLKQATPGDIYLTPACRFSVSNPAAAWKDWDTAYGSVLDPNSPVVVDLHTTTTSTSTRDQLRPKLSMTSFSSTSSTAFPITLSNLARMGGTNYEKTHLTLLKSSSAINELVAHYAGRVIWHLSASNWKVVFGKLRTKIHQLAHASRPNSNNIPTSSSTVSSSTLSIETNMSGTTLGAATTTTSSLALGENNHDLQILTHSILDRSRLLQILNELSSLLVNMSKEHQLEIAGPLRAAIWGWIEWFPQEFNEISGGASGGGGGGAGGGASSEGGSGSGRRGRMDGAPERVFDLLYTKALQGVSSGGGGGGGLGNIGGVMGGGLGGTGERVLWPALTALAAISSDRFTATTESAITNYASSSSLGNSTTSSPSPSSSTTTTSSTNPTKTRHRQLNTHINPHHAHKSTYPTNHSQIRQTNLSSSRSAIKFSEELLRQLRSQGKLSEVALVCALDRCRAYGHVRLPRLSRGGGMRVGVGNQGEEDGVENEGEEGEDGEEEEEEGFSELAVELAHEIKATLTSSQNRKPFWESSEELDVQLYTEVLVTLWRFLPEEDALHVFVTCAEPERSEAVKTVVAGACLTLVMEAPRFPRQKPLDRLEQRLGQRFRDIFKTAGVHRTETDSYGNPKRIALRPKMKRTAGASLNTLYQALNDRENLLLGILALWRARPGFFLYGIHPGPLGAGLAISASTYNTHTNGTTTNGGEDHAPWKEWISSSLKIWEAPIDNSVKVALAGTCRVIAELAFKEQDGPNLSVGGGDIAHVEMMRSMQTTLPLTMLSIATSLIHARVDMEEQRLWMTISHQFLELYMRKVDVDHVRLLQLDLERVPAFVLLEIGYLVSLTSADNNVSHMAAQGLRFISYAERQPDAPLNTVLNDDDRPKRHPVYEQLGDPKVPIVGRVVHQKRIRKLLRLIASPSALHIAVWQECYWRWMTLTEQLVDMVTPFADPGNDSSTFPSNSTRRTPLHHHHHPSSSSSSSTATTMQEKKFQYQNLTYFLAALCGPCTMDNMDLKSLANVISPIFLPDQLRNLQNQNPVHMVGHFVSELTKLLMSDDPTIRDIARDALGAELSPRLYPRLLKHIEDIFRELSNQEVSSQINFVMFAEQFINVVKLVVENMQAHPEEVIAVDLSATMLGFATFLARFNTPELLKIKTKFCLLAESVCDNTSLFTLRKDNLTRHNILDIIVEWMHPPGDPAQDGPIQNDLNLACLKTSVKLLDRLALKPLDNSSTGDDTVHVVSRLFNKYQAVLLMGLESCQIDLPTSDSASELGSIQLRMKASQREAEVRELIITGLAHLVSANTESGFKQCLPLAYSEDTRKRAIFAHVFARVIGQGTKFDPAERSTSVDRHNRLGELVKSADMTLVLAICETCPPGEVDSIISVLLNMFDSRTSLMTLIKLMIDREVSRTESEVSLFRSNSTCTRFLSAFAKIHGYNYLRNLIKHLIRIMAETPQGYDLDAGKVGHAEADQNKENIQAIATAFLEILDSSRAVLPSMFKEICRHLSKRVTAIWPESRFPALGAFMFLRFICPAIVTPETIDIELPGETYRRGLMTIAKIIQNMSNNIFFGKEVHMTVLNDFLGRHIADITRYLSEISREPPDAFDDDDWLGTTTDDTDFIVLHRFFDKHADKIGKELLSISRTSDGDVSAISGKRAWDGLCTLLVDLGPPLDVPRLSIWNSDDHPEYQSLLQRFANRATDSVHEIFVAADSPAEQDAFFILRLSRIDVEVLDVELLMFYIFKESRVLAQPANENRNFSLILDCTGFSSNSEVPLRWLKYCAELVPSDIRSRFTTTHILNPNALTQKYLRRLYNVSGGLSFCPQIRASSSVIELVEQRVPEAVVASLGYPYEIEQEQRESFQEVLMRSGGQMRMPVELVVGMTHIRITSIRAQSISPNLSCKCTEIIPMLDVGDVYNVLTGQEVLDEFIIRRVRSSSTTYLTSPARESIVKTIRLAKGRLKDTANPLSERFSRFSNVPATLLHVGLQCIDMNDEELRASAYDLLGAVCTYLNFDKSPIVAAKAGFVPGNPHSFTVQLSERIADFAPQLTLDFISEVSASMNSLEKRSLQQGQRTTCLGYMSPWMKNLSHFSNPTSPHYERSGARLRDCIRVLCDISIAFPELMTSVQEYIWMQIGNLDTVIVDIVLDELIRSAIDAGIGSHRCETIANIIASLSSISVRGRLWSRLRKAIVKVSPTLAKTSFANNVTWGELSTLLRLALIAGFQTKYPSHNQLYVPEVIHVVALLAGLGTTLVRKTVYGIIVNLLQSVYLAQMEEAPAPEIQELVTECSHDHTLRLFGLMRATQTSEYTSYDAPSDRVIIDNQEKLTDLLNRVLVVTAGSNGLQNVWRARWMGLTTASAFQYSSVIQMRSFTSLGSLASTGVDDDFLYQMLVALKAALTHTSDTETLPVVSMIRSVCKVVPALSESSRFLIPLAWLAVALLQTCHHAFYVEATTLLRVILTDMERREMFQSASVSTVLLEGRAELEALAIRLDHIMGLSFDQFTFSFSLASIIFKGVRHAPLRDHAASVLRTLLRVTVHSPEPDNLDGYGLRNDVLGYFLALLPLSTTTAEYRRLLKDCDVDDSWLPDAGVGEVDDDSVVPRVSPAFLGIQDANTALLVTSFIGAILATAQIEDMETEILFSLLADIAAIYPQTVGMIYEGLHDRVKDVFTNSSNPAIIRSVSDIIRVSLQDVRFGSSSGSARGGASTTDDHASVHGAGKDQQNALEELNMQGLIVNNNFLPSQGGTGANVISCLPELVGMIVT